MRIISKFHDYYDTAMGMGIDPNLIYRRETKLHEFVHWTFDAKILRIFEIPPVWMFRFGQPLAILGFCGRIYPYWLDRNFDVSIDSLTKKPSSRIWLTDAEMVRQHLVSHDPSRQDIDESIALDIAKETRAFEGATISEEIFRAIDAPAFIVRNIFSTKPYQVHTNPRLANFDFMKVFDAFTTFQEISMFLGSQLAPEDRAPRTSGDDKTIAASKGFDQESFRTKAPGNKKLNRKANKRRKSGM